MVWVRAAALAGYPASEGFWSAEYAIVAIAMARLGLV